MAEGCIMNGSYLCYVFRGVSLRTSACWRVRGLQLSMG